MIEVAVGAVIIAAFLAAMVGFCWLTEAYGEVLLALGFVALAVGFCAMAGDLALHGSESTPTWAAITCGAGIALIVGGVMGTE